MKAQLITSCHLQLEMDITKSLTSLAPREWELKIDVQAVRKCLFRILVEWVCSG